MKRMVLPALALVPALLSGCAKAGSIGVIGGADGPTAIYTTTQFAPHVVLLGGIAALVVLAVAGILLYRFAKKRK